MPKHWYLRGENKTLHYDVTLTSRNTKHGMQNNYNQGLLHDLKAAAKPLPPILMGYFPVGLAFAHLW